MKQDCIVDGVSDGGHGGRRFVKMHKQAFEGAPFDIEWRGFWTL